MTIANLKRILSVAVLSGVLSCLAVSSFAQDRPALSKPDTSKVLNWIAGRVAAMRQPFCYRQSYGRGVGVPLSTCPAGQQKNGALCYPDCKAGYGGAGPVCWHTCPSGYTDTGALCHISKSLTAKGGWECHSRKWGVCWLWVLGCPSGYTNAGAFCALNTPSNPPGWSGTGLDLTKDSYGRGAGYPMKCAAGLEEDAGLCYNACKSGYHGVGPVCWQNCPSALTACGAGCANSTTSCVSSTANMVISPIILAVNIATLGTASGGTKAVAEGEQAATLAARASKLAADYKDVIAAAKLANQARNVGTQVGKTVDTWVTDAVGSFADMTTPEVNNTLNQKFAGHPAALVWIKRQYVMQNLNLMMKNDLGETATNTLAAVSSFDPTGVTGVVSAFLNPQCATQDAYPTVGILY